MRWRAATLRSTGVAGQQQGPGLLRTNGALGDRHAVLVELGMDALDPLGALVHERLVQPHPLPPLQDRPRRNPRLGQVAALEQLPQQAGVAAIGLGVVLAAPCRLGVGGLGQVRFEAGRSDLLHDVAPARAALDGQSHRPAVRSRRYVLAQPAPESLTVWLPQPPSPHLPRLHLKGIEGDLLPMQIEVTRDLLPRAQTLDRPHGRLRRSRGGPHTSSVM